MAADTEGVSAEGGDVVARARSGDERAWRTIVDTVGPAVLRFARSRGIHDGEDILGDVLLAISRALPRFRGGLGDLKAFALKVARDRIADRYRRGAGRHEVATSELPDVASALDVETSVAGIESVRYALSSLPDAQRDAVILRVVLDLSYEQVARILGKRAGAVRILVHRALLRLRENLNEGPSSAPPRSGGH